MLAMGVTLAAMALSGPPAGAAGRHPTHRPPVREAPRTVVLDGARLRQASIRLHDGDRQLTATLGDLTAQADGWLPRARGP